MTKPITPEESQEPWSDDELKRKESAQFLTKYLYGKFTRRAAGEETFVLNINAGWGLGKTYFLNNWAKDLQAAGHAVIYFDAWQSDFSDKPLLSFISAIDSSLNQTFNKSPPLAKKTKSVVKTGLQLAKPALPLLLSGYVKQKFGMSFEEILATEGADKALEKAVEVAAESALENHKTLQQSMVSFRNKLKDLVEGIQGSTSFEPPLFILIDELDRCRPSYAIELLEEIKHLFGVAGVCFIVATDTKQLSCSIKAVYGSDFDSERYLHRFFDQVYSLPEPDYMSFSKTLFKSFDSQLRSKLFIPFSEDDPQGSVAFLFATLAQEFELDLRSQHQCFSTLEALLITWGVQAQLHAVLLIFLIMLKQKSSAGFYSYSKSPFQLTDTSDFGFRFGNEKTIYAHRQKTDGFGSEKVSLSMKEAINTYTRIVNLQSKGELVNSYQHSANLNTFEDKIYKSLLNTRLLLSNYTKLVAQAGQLSS